MTRSCVASGAAGRVSASGAGSGTRWGTGSRPASRGGAGATPLQANAKLATFAARSNGIAGITPECVIREGEVADEILKLIEEDEDIAVLVLAAGVDKEGPGPLVSHLGSTAGTFPIPVAIVPGHLSDEEIDAMS